RPRRRPAWRHGGDVRLGPRARAPGPGPADPLRRLERGERLGRRRGGPSLRGRRGERDRGRARPQGSCPARGVLRGRELRAGRPRGARVVSEGTVEHRFGDYGGQYVPETLMPALAELEREWVAARTD